MPWLRILALGPKKVAAKVAALFVVPFLDDTQRVHHPKYGVRDAKDLSYYNIGFRNSAHNYLNRPTPEFTQRGNERAEADWTLDKIPGFQWRIRESVDGEYISFRMTWGKPRKKEGKREFYIGWTMNNKSYMLLTFFQLRPW